MTRVLNHNLKSTTRMKQLKSNSQDLRKLFEQSTTTRHIAEKLQSCKADDDGIAVRKRMQQLDFDVLGIEDKGSVYGYVEQSKLQTGVCRDYQKTFHPSEIIAESTPIIWVLPILRNQPRVFVLERNQVVGIVTRGDLQKAPVRMLLFGLVTLLEMHLLRLIRVHYPDDSWTRYLSDQRLEKATTLLSYREARKEAIDLADCLQFCDKSVLILISDEIRERLGFISHDAGEQFLKEAEKLRDKLAHGQDIVIGSSWQDIIELTEKIEELLKRIETV